MKDLIASLITAASLTTLGFAGTALAEASEKDTKVVIVERNDDGKATKVRIEDKVYDVCMTDAQDNCINPRAAGLNWGNRPLDNWPGESADKA